MSSLANDPELLMYHKNAATPTIMVAAEQSTTGTTQLLRDFIWVGL